MIQATDKRLDGVREEQTEVPGNVLLARALAISSPVKVLGPGVGGGLRFSPCFKFITFDYHNNRCDR